ncbi:MAG: hypothetical protein D6702_00900 [Planctomycetota bacterium]|nr:MAG: hypothetical protein D6702_00900 [Planctomycetota bacterium]
MRSSIMSSVPRPIRPLRCLVAAASGFLFAWFAVGAFETWREIRVQDWNDPDLGWLKIDFWARAAPVKEAAAAAVLTLLLALSGEFLRRSASALPRLLRWGSRTFGRPAGFLLVLALALAPRAVAVLTRPAPPAGAPNVLFILVDTWRADRTSFYGYERPTWPEIGALAQEGVVFERAVAQAPWTRPSVASILTSLTPSRHGAMSHMPAGSSRRFVALDRRHRTLAESLAAAGYDTMAISNNANIVPYFGFGQGFREFTKVSWEVDAGDMAADMERWIDRRDGSRPFFCYLHVTDPHHPYEAPEGFRGMWDKSGITDFNLNSAQIRKFHAGELDLGGGRLQHLKDAYDEEQRYTDSALAPFIRRVREKHPDTIVVLVGDHGEEFLDHGSLGHGHVLYQELTHVPLVLWAPGFSGLRIDTQVPLLDVLPTILDLTGAAQPTPEAMGHSLLPLLRAGGGEDRPAPMETGGDGEPPWQLRGIAMRYDGRLWKLIREEVSEVNPDGVKIHLYDLEADPLEQHDLARERPEVAEALFQAMKEHGWYILLDEVEGGTWHGGAGAAALQGDLQALGYLDGGEDAE